MDIVDIQILLTFGLFLSIFIDSLFFPFTQKSFMECLLVLHIVQSTMWIQQGRKKTLNSSSLGAYILVWGLETETGN